MAAPIFPSADVLLKTVNITLERQLQQHIVGLKQIRVGKRNNDFTKGDMFLSRGCADLSDEVLSAVHEKLLEELSCRLCYCKSISQDKLNSVVIRLNREEYFKNFVTSVMIQKDRYGLNLNEEKEILLVNSSLCQRQVKTSDTDGFSSNISFDILRSLVLEQHLTLLLTANGYKVTNVMSDDKMDDVLEACAWLGLDIDRYTRIGPSEKDITCVLDQLKGHTCLIENNRFKQTDGNSEERKSGEEYHRGGNVDFDMKKYLELKSLPVGKNGFDVNLNQCCLKEDGMPTHVVKQVSMLYQCTKCQKGKTIIHMEGQSQSFTVQKEDLLLKMLTESEPIEQMHFVYGNMTTAKGCKALEGFNVDTYLRTRKNQMREAAIMKYGDSVQGQGWDDTLQALTSACVKFELLSNVARNTIRLKLDSGDERSGESSLQGSFVMYNCARLATLLSHFEESVQKGLYPPLPPVSSVDFSTLREDEEWGLLFNYVYPYPDIVSETVKMIDSKQSIFATFHTHKICQMLIGLSRSVSSYYSRYHVLGEARQHLLSTMYARLYLLKAVHQVMVNSLDLLGICPLTQL